MQTTQNYDFLEYESGDYFNPLTVNNPNIESVDTNLKAVSDRAVGRATELVSQGVHAITVLDTDCKTIKWVATANFTAGETFTVNGIQCNAYLPSGEALGSNAYVSGAQVIASLNDDNSAMTVYVPQGAVAVASDSERLGGELPSYYATKSYADGIKTTADSASNLIQKKALVNTYYDSSAKKLYQVNSDGSQGGEIIMNRLLDFANGELVNTTFTTPKDGAILGALRSSSTNSAQMVIDGTTVASSLGSGESTGLAIYNIPSGSVITFIGSLNTNVNQCPHFVPYL